MYAVYALAGGLAFDALLVALARPTRRTAMLAVAAAWLLPATHPYGGIVAVLAVATLIAGWPRERRRELLPALALFATTAVFLIGDWRLATRFSAGVSGTRSVATLEVASDQLSSLVGGFAGGHGVLALGFAAVALAGAACAWQRHRAAIVFAIAAVLVPVALELLARVPALPAVQAEPRHLLCALPMWSSLLGVAVARAARALSGRVPPAATAALAGCLLVAAPHGARDVRIDAGYWAGVGTRSALAAPAAWIDAHVRHGDVLFPYSVVYLKPLAQTSHAIALPRAEGRPITDALGHVRMPASGIVLAVPLDGATVDRGALASALGTPLETFVSHDWLLVRSPGPYPDRRSIARRAYAMLMGAQRAVATTPATRHELASYFAVSGYGLISAVRDLTR
jgi:hypothetical protein